MEKRDWLGLLLILVVIAVIYYDVKLFILSSLFLLFLPGYYLISFFFPELKLGLEKITYSLVMSIAISVLIGIFLDQLFRITYNYIMFAQAMVCLIFIILNILKINKNFRSLETNVKVNLDKKKFFFFILVFAISLFLIFYPHLDYPYPLHMDEWHNLAKGIHIIDTQTYNLINPYTNTKWPYTDYEVGLQLYIAEFFGQTGLQPVLNYYWIIIFFGVVELLSVFMLLLRLDGKFNIALYSMLFFAFIQTNVNIFGPSILVAITFVIFIVYMLMMFMVLGYEYRRLRFFLISLILFLAGLAVYAPAMAIFALAFLLYIFLRPKLSLARLKYMLKKYKLAIVILVIGLVLLLLYFEKRIGSVPFLLSKLIFRTTLWGQVYEKFSLTSTIGIIPFALGVIGIWNLIKEKRLRMVLSWTIICLIVLLVFSITSFSILARYQRIFLFFVIGMVPLSALGLDMIEQSIKKLKIMKNKQKYFAFCVVIIIILFSFILRPNVPNNFKIYHLIEKDDYKEISMINQYVWKYNYIMAPKELSTVIYPITMNYVYGVNAARYFGGKLNEIDEFFSNDCTAKQLLAKKLEIDAVFSKTRFDCNGFKVAYSGKYTLYKVDTSYINLSNNRKDYSDYT